MFTILHRVEIPNRLYEENTPLKPKSNTLYLKGHYCTSNTVVHMYNEISVLRCPWITLPNLAEVYIRCCAMGAVRCARRRVCVRRARRVGCLCRGGSGSFCVFDVSVCATGLIFGRVNTARVGCQRDGIMECEKKEEKVDRTVVVVFWISLRPCSAQYPTTNPLRHHQTPFRSDAALPRGTTASFQTTYTRGDLFLKTHTCSSATFASSHILRLFAAFHPWLLDKTHVCMYRGEPTYTLTLRQYFLCSSRRWCLCTGALLFMNGRAVRPLYIVVQIQ